MRIQNVDHKRFHEGIVKGKKFIMKEKKVVIIFFIQCKIPLHRQHLFKKISLESPVQYWELNFGQQVVEECCMGWRTVCTGRAGIATLKNVKGQ